MVVTTHRLRVFELEPTISISSPNRPSEIGLGGDVLSSTIPTFDSLHASVVAAGYRPDTAPHNAEWGERFFHLTDPDGHELSFAWPLR